MAKAQIYLTGYNACFITAPLFGISRTEGWLPLMLLLLLLFGKWQVSEAGFSVLSKLLGSGGIRTHASEETGA